MKGHLQNCLCMILIFSTFYTITLAQAQNPGENEKAENKESQQEEIPSCRDLVPPETPEDVKELRDCIRKRKRLIAQKHKKDVIKKMVDRDKELRESKLASYCIYDARRNKCDQIKKPPPANQ